MDLVSVVGYATFIKAEDINGWDMPGNSTVHKFQQGIVQWNTSHQMPYVEIIPFPVAIPYIYISTGPSGAVAISLANGLVGTGFTSWYQLQPRAGF